jgi:hypothetical protein
MAWVGAYNAMAAPAMAPSVVAISRNMPMRMFKIPSLTYADAAPDEVAMTEINEVPMAYRMSIPNPIVNSGTITTPPPSPVSEPINPANKAPAKSMAKKVTIR